MVFFGQGINIVFSCDAVTGALLSGTVHQTAKQFNYLVKKPNSRQDNTLTISIIPHVTEYVRDLLFI